MLSLGQRYVIFTLELFNIVKVLNRFFFFSSFKKCKSNLFKNRLLLHFLLSHYQWVGQLLLVGIVCNFKGSPWIWNAKSFWPGPFCIRLMFCPLTRSCKNSIFLADFPQIQTYIFHDILWCLLIDFFNYSCSVWTIFFIWYFLWYLGFHFSISWDLMSISYDDRCMVKQFC